MKGSRSLEEVTLSIKAEHLPVVIAALKFRRRFSDDAEVKALLEVEKRAEWSLSTHAAYKRRYEQVMQARRV